MENNNPTKHWQFAIRVIRNGYASQTTIRNWLLDCMVRGLACSPRRLTR